MSVHSPWNDPPQRAKLLHGFAEITLQVFLKVEAATDGKSQSLPGFLPKTLEFVAGDGCCCDALECAVMARARGWFGRRFDQ